MRKQAASALLLASSCNEAAALHAIAFASAGRQAEAAAAAALSAGATWYAAHRAGSDARSMPVHVMELEAGASAGPERAERWAHTAMWGAGCVLVWGAGAMGVMIATAATAAVWTLGQRPPRRLIRTAATTAITVTLFTIAWALTTLAIPDTGWETEWWIPWIWLSAAASAPVVIVGAQTALGKAIVPIPNPALWGTGLKEYLMTTEGGEMGALYARDTPLANGRWRLVGPWTWVDAGKRRDNQ